jgi:hypothetical protein
MIEEATDDAYRDSEQTTGWYTMLDEYLALPFETSKSVMPRSPCLFRISLGGMAAPPAQGFPVIAHRNCP